MLQCKQSHAWENAAGGRRSRQAQDVCSPSARSPTERRDRFPLIRNRLTTANVHKMKTYLSRCRKVSNRNCWRNWFVRTMFFAAGVPATLSDYTAGFPNHAEAIGRVCFAEPEDAASPMHGGRDCGRRQATLYLARDNKRDQPVVVKVARESSQEFAAQSTGIAIPHGCQTSPDRADRQLFRVCWPTDHRAGVCSGQNARGKTRRATVRLLRPTRHSSSSRFPTPCTTFTKVWASAARHWFTAI